MDDKKGAELAAKLDKVQERLAKEPDFERNLDKNREVLKESGFTPQEISTFKVVHPRTDRCSCICLPNKGVGTGCNERRGSWS